VQSGRITTIVLAAGAARRFGGRKQLAMLRGRPLLEHAIVAADNSPGEQTIVVLGAFADEIEAGVDMGRASTVRCEDWELGAGASLRAGLRALDPEVDAALVMLGDEPFLAPEAGERLLAARGPGIRALRAAYAVRPGHPVLIERPLFGPMIAALPRAKPAAFLRDAGIVYVDCHDLDEPVDVDTPEQLTVVDRPTEDLEI
jgi:molybdenum cofactor cytidylyltransferase